MKPNSDERLTLAPKLAARDQARIERRERFRALILELTPAEQEQLLVFARTLAEKQTRQGGRVLPLRGRADRG